MISQFFIRSQRGDNIVFRVYRGEVQQGSTEFFLKMKFWKEDGQEEAQAPPPVFLESGAVGQNADFREAYKKLEWGLKKIVGGAEHTLRAEPTFSQEYHGNISKESGPVNTNLTIPMYNASGLQVKYLSDCEEKHVQSLQTGEPTLLACEYLEGAQFHLESKL